MSTIEDIWRGKNDDEIVKAASTLNEYTDEGRSVLLAELKRRSLNLTTETEIDTGDKVKELPRRVVACILTGGLFWVPMVIVQHVRAVAYFSTLSIVIAITVLPVAFSVLAFYRLSRGEGATPKQAQTALLFLLGVWVLGPAAMMSNNISSAAGLKAIGALAKVTLFLTLFFPLTTWAGSAYCGTMGALIIVTSWLMLVFFRNRRPNKRAIPDRRELSLLEGQQ